MLNLNVEKIRKVAVLHCEGRIVRSDAAFRLRDAVTQQRRASVVLVLAAFIVISAASIPVVAMSNKIPVVAMSNKRRNE
jgi:hypothetical protein